MKQRLTDLTPDCVKFGYGTIYIYTNSTPKPLERLAKYDRFWTAWNNVGIAATVALMLGVVAFLTSVAGQTLVEKPQPTAANNPENFLLIPGVNEFLPWSAVGHILAAVVIGIVLHELGHAIAALVEGVGVEEVGAIFLLGIPMGAYVKPSDDLDHAPALPFARVLSAGIMNNLVISALGLFYFYIPGTASIQPVYLAYFAHILNLTVETPALTELSAVALFAFWLVFLNVNLAITNAIPLSILDGGQVAKHTLGEVDQLFGVTIPEQLRGVALVSLYLFVGAILFVVLFGPHFL